jgi:hypothetical protein
MEILKTDDDELRDAGMTNGPQTIGKFTLRPMTPTSLSWLQRNKVFDDDHGDSIQKTAAYVFLHAEAKDRIRAVVNNRAAFLDAVDEWLDANFTHHIELNKYMEHMTESMQAYLSSISVQSNEIQPISAGGVTPAKN